MTRYIEPPDTGQAPSQDKKLRCERCGETFDQHWKVGHPCVGFLHDPEKKLVLKSKASPSVKEPGKLLVSGCSRCGDSFDEHFIPGHECKGFKPWVPYKVPTKSYAVYAVLKDPEFKPLDMYGNYIIIPDLDMSPEIGREALEALQAQIDGIIPRGNLYRRCVKFTHMKNIHDLTTTITWKYTADLQVVVEEVDKIRRYLRQEPDPAEYKIYPVARSVKLGVAHFLVHKRHGESWVKALDWMFLSRKRAQTWIDTALLKQQIEEVRTNGS